LRVDGTEQRLEASHQAFFAGRRRFAHKYINRKWFSARKVMVGQSLSRGGYTGVNLHQHSPLSLFARRGVTRAPCGEVTTAESNVRPCEPIGGRAVHQGCAPTAKPCPPLPVTSQATSALSLI
jgi:hypothetical protein